MLELVRLRDFTHTELAAGLHQSALASRELLRLRNASRNFRRLGADAVEAVRITEWARAQDEASEVGTNGQAYFAVVCPEKRSATSVGIVGAGTIIRGLEVYVQRLHLKQRLPRWLPARLVRHEVDLGKVNIAGWTEPAYTEQLTDVYSGLLDKIPGDQEAWTVEPVRSGLEVRTAITGAGMIPSEVVTAYDVGNDRFMPTPPSQAYVRANW